MRGRRRTAVVKPVVDHVYDRIQVRVLWKTQPVQPVQVAGAGGLCAAGDEVSGHDLPLPFVQPDGRLPRLEVEHISPRRHRGQGGGGEANGQVDIVEHEVRLAQYFRGLGQDLADGPVAVCVLQDLHDHVHQLFSRSVAQAGCQTVRGQVRAVPLVVGPLGDPLRDVGACALVRPDHIAVVRHIGHNPRSACLQVDDPLVPYRAGKLDQVQLRTTARLRLCVRLRRPRVDGRFAQHEPIVLGMHADPISCHTERCHIAGLDRPQ